ncbi:MAG TPA: hypothetical protein VMR28_01730 [Candidatus Saccharimonadales bacterium]|nr:hypothetical protein [Candidatus Saccharimonadales bacterium]
MKLLVLYKPKSEHARSIDEYTNDFIRVHPDVTLELMDAESVEGVAKAGLYDILQFPALLALADDNSLLNMWTGDLLPLMQEVAAYLYG